MFGIIYLITNTINGKQYVGQTTSAISRRWRQHVRAARNGSLLLLACAIRKHGEKSFYLEQLDVGNSRQELNEKEINCIAQLGTLASNGYNLTLGGEGATPSEETRKKISEKARHRNNGNYGKPAPVETRQKLSQIALFERHPVSQETRDKIATSSRNHRKTRCKHGHPFDETNTYIKPCSGQRVCLVCWYLGHHKPLPKKLEKYRVLT